MPTHEPEPSEPYYDGEFYDGHYNREDDGATVTYRYTEDDGMSYDPDAVGDVEWLEEPVAGGSNVNWSDDAEKRAVGAAILKHRLDRAPTPDEMGLFMEEIAPKLEDGQPFRIGTNALDDAGL